MDLAGLEADELAEDMTPLLDMIVAKVSAPDVEEDAPFRMQISALDSNSYVGVIGIGRITGWDSVKPNDKSYCCG
jgi:GTP-binding protein